MKRISLERVLAAYIDSHELADTTERNYRYVIRLFERWHGGPATLRDLATRANDYVRFRLNGGAVGDWIVRGNRTTAAGIRINLASLLRFAARKRWCRRIRLRPMRKPRIIPHAFLTEEIELLLAYARPLQRAAIMLAFDTGFRRSDVFGVCWRAVSETNRGHSITKIVNKTGRVETRLVRPETLTACRAARLTGDDRLVPTASSTASWAKAWYRLGRRAGVCVHRRGLQAVRRAGASYVQANGGSAQKYLGHATADLAEKYYLDPRIVSTVPDLPPQFSDAAINDTPATPLERYLREFAQHVEATYPGQTWALSFEAHLRIMLKAAGIVELGDLTPIRLRAAIAAGTEQGAPRKVLGQQVSATEWFLTWLCDDRGQGRFRECLVVVGDEWRKRVERREDEA